MTSTDETTTIGTGPVVGAPDPAAATPADLLPPAADHFALFQQVDGEDLRAWADARSFAARLGRLNQAWED